MSNGRRKLAVFFSGTRSWKGYGGEAELFQAIGWEHRCLSFAYLDPESPVFDRTCVRILEYCRMSGVKWFMDSGAFSYHKTLAGAVTQEAVEALLRRYAKYAKENPDFEFAATFDYIRHCPTIFDVTKRLGKLGLKAMPVYHADDSLDYVRRYHDLGHTLIGLGKQSAYHTGVRQRNMDQIFNLTEKLGMRCHGFAVTGSKMLLYPWYSVDSTAWLQAAIHGKLVLLDSERHKASLVHVSTEAFRSSGRNKFGFDFAKLQPAAAEYLKAKAGKYGLSWEGIQSTGFYRAIYNARVYMDFAGGSSQVTHHNMDRWTSVLG